MTTDDGLKGLTDAQLVALYSELRHTSKEFCGLPHPMKNWTEEHDAAIANAARAWLAANVHDSGDGDIAKLEAKIFDRLSRLERRSDNGTYMNIPAEISAGYLWETCQDIRLFLKYRHTAMQAASNAILAEKGEV